MLLWAANHAEEEEEERKVAQGAWRSVGSVNWRATKETCQDMVVGFEMADWCRPGRSGVSMVGRCTVVLVWGN